VGGYWVVNSVYNEYKITERLFATISTWCILRIEGLRKYCVGPLRHSRKGCARIWCHHTYFFAVTDWSNKPVFVIVAKSQFRIIDLRVHGHIESKNIIVHEILSHHAVKERQQSRLSHSRVGESDDCVEAA
jgi:hypothetical protein